jgi:uncharacterized protein with PIN domain
MKVERPEDLIFWTYHMFDWSKAKQTHSTQRCVKCDNEMNVVEAVAGKGGQSYSGMVCHSCKTIVWIRNH